MSWKKVEELEHYIGELEARQDEQLISAEDARLKHMEEVKTFEERIGDLQATIDLQTAKLEIMERDVERLETDNDCLRTENQVIIDERLQNDMTWAHAWHAVQEDLIEYIKSFEV
jgi:predicted RNase H-like nuclease (RuvC/YqgF family)